MTTPVAYSTYDAGVGPRPTNAIVVSGQPSVENFTLKTAANCYPGRFVTKDTDQNKVAVCGAAGTPYGVLGYEHCNKKDRPATRATIYVVDAQVPVLRAGVGKTTVMLYLSADAATIVKGDKLVLAAAGCVTKAGAAKFATSTAAAVLGAGASPTIAGNIPTEGIVVATAEEEAVVVDIGGWIMATLEI